MLREIGEKVPKVLKVPKMPKVKECAFGAANFI
jgi:hypothetical protein